MPKEAIEGIVQKRLRWLDVDFRRIISTILKTKGQRKDTEILVPNGHFFETKGKKRGSGKIGISRKRYRETF